MTRPILLAIVALTLTACEDGCDLDHRKQYARERREAWVAECHDESVLLATTSGSPSQHTCPNQHHVMHVQTASAPSNEEFGALVFCECKREPAPVPSAVASASADPWKVKP